MRCTLQTAGEVAVVDAPAPWAERPLRVLGDSGTGAASQTPTVRVRTVTAPVPDPGVGRRLGRGVATDGEAVVLRSACSSGIDIGMSATEDVVEVAAARRPQLREAILHRLLSRRADLLAADVLLHYPVLWRAGWRGRVPLHAAALVVEGRGVLVVGASGVGKTTLVQAEVAAGATFVSDNLVVSDGDNVWGLLEPLRSAAATGPRTTHGRRLTPVTARQLRSGVDLVVVLRRDGAWSGCRSLAPLEAARDLAASTYSAGELRRYWGFAATLAAGTGRGPVHPAVTRTAHQICTTVPCVELELGDRPGARLSGVLDSMEVGQWT
jgi:hypothetical protein